MIPSRMRVRSSGGNGRVPSRMRVRSSGNNTGTEQQAKDEIDCHFYAKGICNKGEVCEYKHDDKANEKDNEKNNE